MSTLSVVKPIRIRLPISKSVGNRILLLQALSGQQLLSLREDWPDDMKIMATALQRNEGIIDVGHAGTAMRFLAAYFATQVGQTVHLKGSERMHQRPISPLVNALRQLGAQIRYLNKEGYPPLQIQGTTLRGSELHIDGSISSQYTSALMMVGGTRIGGLRILSDHKFSSLPYILLTAKLMEQWGCEVMVKENKVEVSPGKAAPHVPDKVEPDWSAASYFYALCSLMPDSEFLLLDLRAQSAQGDRVLMPMFRQYWGVESTDVAEGLHIKQQGRVCQAFQYDFSHCPDLAQTMAFLAACHSVDAELLGLESLKIKETDRIAALAAELPKLGVQCQATDNSLKIIAFGHAFPERALFNAYDDHRMVMSAALAMAKGMQVQFDHPEVVSKSFPYFWEEWAKAIR